MKEEVLAGDRRALAKALTLIESQKSEHQEQAQKLLTELLPFTGKSYRLGISGPPGVGKSTFIEGFGNFLIKNQSKKIAVLAVDPSSPVSGGSLLADKTRMETLSQSDQAFIRPSPSSGALGGVANKTRECMLLCEAAGFDFILIETVGVGQSEYEVANMVDFLLTLMLPNAGDEIQGIKKGLLELTQAIVVNKWDGDLKTSAELAANQYKMALGILNKNTQWQPPVHVCSSIENKGYDEIFKSLTLYKEQQDDYSQWQQKRVEQRQHWFEKLVKANFQNLVESKYKDQWVNLSQQVEEQQTTPYEAMQKLFKNIGI